MQIEQKDYNECGKSELIREAQILAEKRLLQIKWLIRESDIEQVTYRVEDLEKFYELRRQECTEECPSKQERIWRYQHLLTEEMKHIKSTWIGCYYRDILGRLENGDIPKMLKKHEVYFASFRGIDELEAPMFKRIFSRKYLRNSKIFENEVERHVISTAKKYCEETEDEMSNTEVLSQLFIEEYSQELALKGPLRICVIKGSKQVELDLNQYFYGTVLNSETLKNTVIQAQQPDIQKVITIENKANFMSAEYDRHTLYIFTHGYVSPRERDFLKSLEKVLAGKDIEFYHSGDLDYGGVKIYEYMKRRIFSRIKPMMMDVETYEKYCGFGEPIPDITLKKLARTHIPQAQPLIERMLEKKLGIEQECFLI